MLAQMVWEQSLDANGIPLDDALQGNPDDRSGDWFWRAGVRVVDPETKKVLYAPDVNYAEKVKQDALDRLRQSNPEANLNGLFFRLERVERTKR